MDEIQSVWFNGTGRYIENPKKEFCVFAHTCMYLCMSVLLFKCVGASLSLKHKDSVGSQPQKDWLPDLVFKQVTRCRTRQESLVGTEGKDGGLSQTVVYQNWAKNQSQAIVKLTKVYY